MSCGGNNNLVGLGIGNRNDCTMINRGGPPPPGPTPRPPHHGPPPFNPIPSPPPFNPSPSPPPFNPSPSPPPFNPIPSPPPFNPSPSPPPFNPMPSPPPFNPSPIPPPFNPIPSPPPFNPSPSPPPFNPIPGPPPFIPHGGPPPFIVTPPLIPGGGPPPFIPDGGPPFLPDGGPPPFIPAGGIGGFGAAGISGFGAGAGGIGGIGGGGMDPSLMMGGGGFGQAGAFSQSSMNAAAVSGSSMGMASGGLGLDPSMAMGGGAFGQGVGFGQGGAIMGGGLNSFGTGMGLGGGVSAFGGAPLGGMGGGFYASQTSSEQSSSQSTSTMGIMKKNKDGKKDDKHDLRHRPMSIRPRFSKSDQDQLASFLATHPGDWSGNAVYRQFAGTHTKHSWSSWRHHYLSNSALIKKLVHRKRRQLRTATAAANRHGIIELLDDDDAGNRNRGPKRKGKEVAPIELIEIDSSFDSNSDHAEPGSQKPESIASSRQPRPPQREFHLQRIPSNPPNRFSSSSSATDLNAFSGQPQLGKSRWDPHVRVVPMSREEEQNFFAFISGYPKGDLRFSSILYEKYHRQPPYFSPEEYRTYYLVHQARVCTKRPVSDPKRTDAPGCAQAAKMITETSREDGTEKDESGRAEERTEKPSRETVSPFASTHSPDTHKTIEDTSPEEARDKDEGEREEERTESARRETVSPSPSLHNLEDDEIPLDEILRGLDHPKIAAALDLSPEKMAFVRGLQHDLFWFSHINLAS
ncbi:hypothetical protein PtA15_10A140 [Puccinia triticina]|uniref:TERF2-interacting telomeric protein 1 Myb domain-containing protein n=1 Tax=Puccinia triticina TaxID=208348 RepID=A0ABY7CX78_9BASI|nr:uncharacterized protein PtA15_10A140 [Puccinia triticina]WAQ88721.1 hypothetical protein PtA15_10A140 [Puccinia triticina]